MEAYECISLHELLEEFCRHRNIVRIDNLLARNRVFTVEQLAALDYEALEKKIFSSKGCGTVARKAIEEAWRKAKGLTERYKIGDVIEIRETLDDYNDDGELVKSYEATVRYMILDHFTNSNAYRVLRSFTWPGPSVDSANRLYVICVTDENLKKGEVIGHVDLSALINGMNMSDI